MRTLNRQTLIGAWIGLALLIPGLCLVHALPHAHAGEAHSHPEPTPAPVAHHEHGHHHGDDHGHAHGHDHAPPEESHHHHSLDDHFESDPVRLQKRAQVEDCGPLVIDTVAVDVPTDTGNATTLVPDSGGAPPGVPIVAGAPRAPPLSD